MITLPIPGPKGNRFAFRRFESVRTWNTTAARLSARVLPFGERTLSFAKPTGLITG